MEKRFQAIRDALNAYLENDDGERDDDLVDTIFSRIAEAEKAWNVGDTNV